MIFTDRTIRVKKGASSIDDSIVLYRGDKDVEIRFTLNESSPFRFGVGADPNIIEKTEAAYGQLIIKTPNGLPAIFSEIAPTNGGKIVFTITTEMIDEITEVGDYTFQIRLLDESRNSRATLPEVVNGIEIREPIATEDVSTTNEVGVATVGYALTTAGTTEDAFDSQGNYNKTTWQTGDRITAAKLDKIENGIDGVNKKVANTGGSNINDTTASATTTYSSNKIESIKEDLSSQIKETAKKTIIEDNKLYLLKEDGTKIDTGTKLPTNGSAGIVVSNNVETYKCEDIGELFDAKTNYEAWGMTTQYDKTLDKFVVLVNHANEHLFSSCSHSLYFIDPYDFTISEHKEIGLDAIQIAICNFMILDDGTYMFICREGTRTGTGNNHKYTSTDKGTSWTDNGEVTGIVDGKNYHLWNLKKLSNGRLIAGIDVANKGIAYSDDNGSSWSIVVPSGGSGDYKAETCIIELETDKLMAIARKNISGTGYNSSGDSDKALISYSIDNGTSWSDWIESNSIDNMNASCCDGIVHDGVVEVFATSGWYHNGDNSNTDDNNTGKSGAMMHYTATVENALNDNFTKKGIIDYAKGASGEYHAPSLSRDNNGNVLIMHMDGASTNGKSVQRFIRGSLDNLSYLATDGSKSQVKAYSAKYTEILLKGMLDKINTLQYMISQIPGSGVTPPSDTKLWTKTYVASEAGTYLSNSSTELAENYYANTYPELQKVYTQDANGDYYSQSYQGGIFMEVTKANCACYMDVATISGKGTGALGAGIGILVDGVLHFSSFIEYFSSIFDNARHTFEVVYQDGNFELSIDGRKNTSYWADNITDLTQNTCSLAMTQLKGYLGVSEVPSTGTYIIMLPNQSYMAWYEAKLGEWD